MREISGWLLDVYAHPSSGVVVWLVGADGRRHFFRQDFEMVFYAGGPFAILRELWRWLKDKPVRLARTRRDDLYSGAQDVLEVRVAGPAAYAELFKETSECFPELSFYDADIPLSLRYAAAYRVFPLARCRVTARPDGRLLEIAALDTPWELDPGLPVLRELSLAPDCDPAHALPQTLRIAYQDYSFRLPLDRPRELLRFVNNLLWRYDPDVILTDFGDTWLFGHLEELARQSGLPFNPNRDLSRQALRRKEISFHNYGQAHYRGEQVHLFGRWHIDRQNCMTFSDYGIAGAVEQARLTGLPVQEVARRSPGAGIAAMQTLTALRRGVLVPYRHQKGELPKSYNQLFKADRGGLVFEPLPGVFPNVAILDFVSMYPSIMVKYNLSPETVGADDPDGWEIPELGVRVGTRPGLVPETLRPVLEKRVAFKRLLRTLDKDDPRYGRTKSLSKALKWLLVVAYGRLGYANAAFGRINSHEAVTHIGRGALLQAKSLAEDRGFLVLHMYVDSLFICRPEARAPEDFQELLEEIERETWLPIELEALYAWMAFAVSRQNPGLTVANRFFGLQQDGEYKIRGLALRREDTPGFVAQTQLGILEILAQQHDPARLLELLPQVREMLRGRLCDLRQGNVPPGELLVTQTLSRELEDYRVASPLARAALQLQEAGRALRMGQRVQYLHTLGEPGVRAWDLPGKPDMRTLDVSRYRELLLRAAGEVLQPLGVERDALEQGYAVPAGSLFAELMERVV